MLAILAVIAGLAAVGAWIVAVVSALSIVQLAPAGRKMSVWFTLGWWRFDRVRTVTGPAADPHIRRYVLAFAAFFLAILVGATLIVLVGLSDRAGAPELASASNGKDTEGNIFGMHQTDPNAA